MRILSIILLLTIALTACKPEVYTPKPKGYFNIELPSSHTYKKFNMDEFPYSFEHPTFSNITRDTSFFGQKPENPYWIIIDYKKTGGKLYISYKEISKGQKLQKLIEDSYGMSYTVHNVKADYIDDNAFHFYNRNVHGIFYNVGGNTASAYQFFATDSTKHFIRGALYFNNAPNADSLKPVHDFLVEDIDHMLKTLNWK